MSTTPIRADANEADVPITAFLTAESGATGTPNPSGYTLTLGSNYGEYTFDVVEALIGIFRLTLENASGTTVAMGYVWIRADDTNLYIATAGFASAQLQSICVPIMEDLEDGGRLDVIIDAISSTVSSSNTEINKIPRSASAITAGEFRQTNQKAEYMDITFTEPS